MGWVNKEKKKNVCRERLGERVHVLISHNTHHTHLVVLQSNCEFMHVALEPAGATSAQNIGNTYLGVFDAEGLGSRVCPRNNLEEKQGKTFPFNASELSDQTKYVSLDCMGLEGYRESDDRGGALPMCWGGGISCLDQGRREVGHGAQDAGRAQSSICRL